MCRQKQEMKTKTDELIDAVQLLTLTMGRLIEKLDAQVKPTEQVRATFGEVGADVSVSVAGREVARLG